MDAPRAVRLPPFQAAILDMDGLVLDSESSYVLAWRRAAADLGFHLDEAFCRRLFGRHWDDVERRLIDALGDRFDGRRFQECGAGHWRRHLAEHGLARMPGVERLLASFRQHGIPFALATNSDGPYARECLRWAGLESEFSTIVTRDQVPLGKPEPDVFLEAARRLGVPSELCLGIEDSETGLQAATAAGTISVLIQRHEGLRRQFGAQAAFALSSLNELADLIESAG